MYRDVFQDLYRAVVPVHFYDANVSAEGVWIIRQGVRSVELQAWRHVWRQQLFIVGRRSYLRERYSVLWRPLSKDLPLPHYNVFRRALKDVSSYPDQFLAGLLKHGVDRGAAHGYAPAGAGTTSGGEQLGVAVEHLHVRRRHPQFIGDDLGESGLGTLAVGRDTAVDRYPARGIDDDPGVVGTPFAVGARSFGHSGQTHAD